MSENRKVRFAPETEMTTFKESNVQLRKPKPKIVLPTEVVQPKNKRGSLNPLEDLVQCALCMDRLTEPKMLLCQHTFCLNCLQFHLSPGVSQVACPTCKHVTPLEKSLESLSTLPGNLYITSILKLLSGSISPMTPTTKGPETRCIKCQSLCQFSEHACQHCKQVFCGVCWSSHITELQEQLNSLRDQLIESHSQLDHRVDAFKDRCTQLEESIRHATELKIKEIKHKEHACLQQASKIKEDGMTTSKLLRKRIEEMQKSIHEKEFGKITDNHQKITHFMSLHRNTATLLDEVSRWGDTRTIFDIDNFKIDSEADASPDAEADDEDGTTTNIVCVRNPLESHESLLMHYKTKIFSPKLTWNKCLRPAGAGIAPWNSNCIYVAGSDSRHIYGIDKQTGKLLYRITTPSMLCPVGITFSSKREEMYVSDKWKHCIHVFDKKGNYLKTLGKKGDGPAQFSSPEGLVVTPDDLLFICDTGNDRIQILNAVDGSFKYCFGITGEGVAISSSGMVMDFKYTELNIPTGIAIHDNKVILADSGNRRIKIYTLDGHKLHEFGTLGKNKGQFRTPEVVAVDPLGFIIVGDSGNARIQIFKPNGTLVRVFRNKGKFAWISGLHVTPQLEMIITDYKNHTVQVF